jgi:hypothetical protein
MFSQLRAGIDVVCPVRRERSGGVDAHPSRLDLFADILRMIAELRSPPVTSTA